MTFRDIDFHPNDKKLRTFAVLWLVGFGLLALLVAWRVGGMSPGAPIAWQLRWRAPIALCGVAIVGSVVGLAWPAALRPIYVAWMVAAFPIGWAVNQAVLLVIFYGLFTAVSLVLRLIGRDALHRSFDRDAASYWIQRPAPRGVDRYFRQS